jgi:hypothetical protein
MKIIKTEVVVNTTNDCIKLIDPENKYKFKRKMKFSSKDCYDYTIRVFEDAKYNIAYTIISGGYDKTVILDIDLSLYNNIIKELKIISKKIYTFDGYGTIYFNPLNCKVYINSSDCGIIYFEGSKQELKKRIREEDDYIDDNYEYNFNTIVSEIMKIDGIKEVEIEYENSPQEENSSEYDVSYIPITECIDMGFLSFD